MENRLEKNKITQLISRYYEGVISAVDLAELKQHVLQDASQDEEIALLKEIFGYEESVLGELESKVPDTLNDSIMAGIRHHEKEKRVFRIKRLRTIISVAAAVLILIVAGSSLFTATLSEKGADRREYLAESEKLKGRETNKGGQSGYGLSVQAKGDTNSFEQVETTGAPTEMKKGIDKTLPTVNIHEKQNVVKAEPEYTEEEINEKRAEVKDYLAMLCGAFSGALSEYEESVCDMNSADAIMKL